LDRDGRHRDQRQSQHERGLPRPRPHLGCGARRSDKEDQLQITEGQRQGTEDSEAAGDVKSVAAQQGKQTCHHDPDADPDRRHARATGMQKQDVPGRQPRVRDRTAVESRLEQDQ